MKFMTSHLKIITSRSFEGKDTPGQSKLSESVAECSRDSLCAFSVGFNGNFGDAAF